MSKLWDLVEVIRLQRTTKLECFLPETQADMKLCSRPCCSQNGMGDHRWKWPQSCRVLQCAQCSQVSIPFINRYVVYNYQFSTIPIYRDGRSMVLHNLRSRIMHYVINPSDYNKNADSSQNPIPFTQVQPYIIIKTIMRSQSLWKVIENVKLRNLKNAVFRNVTLCDSCKNRLFGVKYRLHHLGDKDGRARNSISSN
jgi:hypothetical protein